MSSALSQPPRRLGALDGVRGLAALAVLCFHVIEVTAGSASRSGWPALPRFAVAGLGANGVSVFFVLSAFLLARPFLAWLVGRGSRPSLSRYLQARVFRIWPAWLVALAVAVVTLSPWVLRRPGVLVTFALLGQNWVGLGQRVIPQGWTLGVEVTFYLAAPLGALLAWPLLRRLTATGAALAIALALVAASAWAWWFELLWLPSTAPAPAGLALSLPAQLDRFCVGALAALALLVLPRRAVAARVAILAAVGIVLLGLGVFTRERYQVCAIGFGLMIYALAADERMLPARALAVWPLRELGRLSYGVYLWHLPLLYAAERVGLVARGGVWQAALVLAGLVGCSLLLAELSYRLVEQPALRLASRWSAPYRRLAVQRRVIARRARRLAAAVT